MTKENILKSLAILKTVVITVDNYITSRIDAFFLAKGYFAHKNVPAFAANIPVFFKLLVYLVAALFLLMPLKIVFPESKLRSLITYACFFSIIGVTFTIFFGFFQLMYNF